MLPFFVLLSVCVPVARAASLRVLPSSARPSVHDIDGARGFNSRHLSSFAVNPSGPSVNIDVISMGADPTGVNDSTTILQHAIDDAALLRKSSTYPSAVGSAFVTVELAGGVYRVTSPLTLHGSNYSGIIIRGGTLFADENSFPANGYVLDCEYCSQMSFLDLTIDNNHRGGGMRFDTALQVRAGALEWLIGAVHG